MAKKINKPQKRNDTRIPDEALKHKFSYDEDKARLTFSSACVVHCQLSEWFGSELSTLIGCFKKLESMPWKDIKKDNGLDYESISNTCIPRPGNLPPDASLDSLRVSGKSRLYGYRTREFFNIIWFDKNHIVCAMDKQRKYKI